MPTYAALLRGVNLGPHKKVSMTRLRELCEELGHREVTTYIQSGNVVFSSSRRSAPKVGEELAGAIEAEFGHAVPVVVRTPAELERIVSNNPFLGRGVDPKALAVAFLSAPPTPEAIRALDPDRSPGDEFVVEDVDVHLHYPNGLGRSKLDHQYLERTLGVVATIRNWNTVNKLRELTGRR